MSTSAATNPLEQGNTPSALRLETVTGHGTVYVATHIGDIIAHAAGVLELSANEQESRTRAHTRYQSNPTEGLILRTAAHLSQEAMRARRTSRYLLGQNQLFGFTVEPPDMLMVAGPTAHLYGPMAYQHTPAGKQGGRTVVGYQLHFTPQNQPSDREPLVYLTESNLHNDQPTGIEVGISLHGLMRLQALSREQAGEAVTASGQLITPTGPVLYTT